jgi:hypothetical protein
MSGSSIESEEAQFHVAFDNVMLAMSLESDVETSNDNVDETVVELEDVDDNDELNENTFQHVCIKHNFNDREMYYLLRGVKKFGEESWSQIFDYYKEKFENDKTADDLQIRFMQVKSCKYSKLLYKHIFVLE